MDKVVDYTIVRSDSAVTLCREISRNLAEGWQPYGALVRDKVWFYQPMVKYEDSADISYR